MMWGLSLALSTSFYQNHNLEANNWMTLEFYLMSMAIDNLKPKT